MNITLMDDKTKRQIEDSRILIGIIIPTRNHSESGKPLKFAFYDKQNPTVVKRVRFIRSKSVSGNKRLTENLLTDTTKHKIIWNNLNA